MRLTKQLATLVGAMAVVGSLAFATPAFAAPGYPGTTTTTSGAPVGTPPGGGTTIGCRRNRDHRGWADAYRVPDRMRSGSQLLHNDQWCVHEASQLPATEVAMSH